jgi:hypothetical protein
MGWFTNLIGAVTKTDHQKSIGEVKDLIREHSMVQGPAGRDGLQGPIGPQGPVGPQGLKGDAGNDAVITAIHEDSMTVTFEDNNGEQLRVTKLRGSDGSRGPAGIAGADCDMSRMDQAEADLKAVGNNINLLHELGAAQDANITAKASKSEFSDIQEEVSKLISRLNECCPEAAEPNPGCWVYVCCEYPAAQQGELCPRHAKGTKWESDCS